MAFFELTKENVGDYVREKTGFFQENEPLTVYEFGENEESDGDGFVNFVYRVTGPDGKSVIVKQAKENLKKIRDVEKNPLKQERNKIEASVMRVKSAVVKENIPEVYYIDEENHAYICEDCSHLPILRFELMKGKRVKDFGARVGTFLAKTNFYTSEIYMDAVQHRKLQAAFLNPSLRLVFEMGLFLHEENVWSDRKMKTIPEGTPQALVDVCMAPWEDEDFRTEMLRLRQRHMKKAECLVHGDLHTSNIMISDDEMKMIDQEYTYMGLASCDTGYVMGSLLYEYIRWRFLGDPSMADYVLVNMEELLTTYEAVYRECWDEDAKAMYKPRKKYREILLKEFMNEVCGATGTQVISRIGGFVSLPDFDSIKDEEVRFSCQRVAMWTAKDLIMNWESCQTPQDLIDRIKKAVLASEAVLEMSGSLKSHEIRL